MELVIFLSLFAIGFISGWRFRDKREPSFPPPWFDDEYQELCAKIMREQRTRASKLYFDIFNAGMLCERSSRAEQPTQLSH